MAHWLYKKFSSLSAFICFSVDALLSKKIAGKFVVLPKKRTGF